MVGSDSCAKADGREIARFSDIDTQFRSLYIQFARFNLRTKAQCADVHISFGRQRSQYIFVGQGREVDVHFILPIQFEQLFQLQFVIFKSGLRGDKLVSVGAYLCFQLREVTFGNTSGIQKFLSSVALCNGNLQGVFVYFHRFGCIKNLDIYLGDRLLNIIFGSRHIQLGHLIIQLFLLDGFQPFITII